jgi:hypothetical protein
MALIVISQVGHHEAMLRRRRRIMCRAVEQLLLGVKQHAQWQQQ